MNQWFTNTIDKYIYVILWGCFIILLTIYLWNLLTNKRGTFTNHSEMIKTLLEKPTQFKNLPPFNLLPTGPRALSAGAKRLTTENDLVDFNNGDGIIRREAFGGSRFAATAFGGSAFGAADGAFDPVGRSLLGFNKSGSNSFQSRGEMECKRVIEKITGRSFTKTRPTFLKNEITGQNLELDCYNPELKLAIEYNGEQHYKYTPRFHRTRDSFYNTKYRDQLKMELCKKNNIKLIIVPYTVKICDIERFILDSLNEVI
jgi:hypothetical protein